MKTKRGAPKCSFKVSIIGAGNVGATATYALLLGGIPTELALIDIVKSKAEGVILDMDHSLAFLHNTVLKGSDNFKDCAGSQVVIITAGARQEDGQTRLDLIDANRKIFETIVPKIMKHAPHAIIVVVSNPVDVLTQIAAEIAGFEKGRVFGSGTMLDTARFRYHLSEHVGVSPHNVETFILGEHGDSSFPVLSRAEIAGMPLKSFKGLTKKTINDVYTDTRDAAYRIIHDIGYTCYSIGVVISKIIHHIYYDSREIVPLSVPLDTYYTRKKVSLSVPCVLGRRGVVEQMHFPLSLTEKRKMKKAVDIMQGFLRS